MDRFLLHERINLLGLEGTHGGIKRYMPDKTISPSLALPLDPEAGGNVPVSHQIFYRVLSCADAEFACT
jgi:hypothetical protein